MDPYVVESIIEKVNQPDVNTIISMKEAIESAPQRIPCIGTCIDYNNIESESTDEDSNELETESDPTDAKHEIFKLVEQIDRSPNVKTMYRCHNYNYDFSIKYDEITYHGSLEKGLPVELMQILLEKLPNATYGDMKNHETKIDTKTRMGVDLRFQSLGLARSIIRTIFISLQDLLASDKISIPFESKLENKIDKISISSKLVFKSYGLKVIND